MHLIIRNGLFLLFLFASVLQNSFAQKTGITACEITSDSQSADDFPLCFNGKVAGICYDTTDWKGVIRALGDLQTDIEKVTSVKPFLTTTVQPASALIMAGTLGKSKWMDKLVARNKLKLEYLRESRERFALVTVNHPAPGVEKGLLIVGSDKRGTIYGIYELSRLLGISPWYWWADVPVRKKASAFVCAGKFVSVSPVVQYRGIFINDEAPCFTGWSQEKFGGRNSKMYAHVFELLLRLRANYLWPAMWSSAFNEDDAENARLADEYGIVMGTSHHEPMLRSAVEWARHKQEFGNGQWNYVTNKQGILDFWKKGLQRNKHYESVLTMGMRGDGDEPMPDAGSAQENFKVLQTIMADQRRIVEEVTGKPASATPQIWALYSEVLEYFDQGMKVPDDMIILLCDDNWGDVRRLPELSDKRHPGGYGMYYHVDLHGAPRAYQWLNMTQIPHMWEQLQLTHSYGVDKMWILNVGDIKPMEYPMSFFLDMAWNPDVYNENAANQFGFTFCKEQFGEQEATQAAEILNTCCKYNSRISAEMLDDRTYNLNNGEFLQVRDAYLALEAKALRQYLRLDTIFRDAYKELILHPVQAMANLYDMYYAVAMNKKLAAENDLSANGWADLATSCFQRDASLSDEYNHAIANGKWNHMMDQTHIGYTSWDEPRKGNILPKVVRLNPAAAFSGRYHFTENNGVVAMEAPHYWQADSTESTHWICIPDLGRNFSATALMPYTKPATGAGLLYQFTLRQAADSLKIWFYFDSTLPFRKGGHRVAASLDGGPEIVFNINDQLNWKNNYSRMYPAAAARMIEIQKNLQVPLKLQKEHQLQIRPLDPGVVFYKIVVDNGGYVPSYLKLPESPYKRVNP